MPKKKRKQFISSTTTEGTAVKSAIAFCSSSIRFADFCILFKKVLKRKKDFRSALIKFDNVINWIKFNLFLHNRKNIKMFVFVIISD